MAFKVPVVLLIYNRPDLTARVARSIAAFRPDQVFIIADGPRPNDPLDARKCSEARLAAESLLRLSATRRNFSTGNLGCKERVATGLSWVFAQVPEAIILEDDCVPSPDFFPYCEKLLALYRHEPRIMHIGGCNWQADNLYRKASYYFSRYFDVWGWATWSRAWKHYDPFMRTWPEIRKRGKLKEVFRNPAEYAFWEALLTSTFNGGIDTWDFQWYYHCWIRNGLGITPARNLVSNIGFREDATHTRKVKPLIANCHVANLAGWAEPASAGPEESSDWQTFRIRHMPEVRTDIASKAWAAFKARVKNLLGLKRKKLGPFREEVKYDHLDCILPKVG